MGKSWLVTPISTLRADEPGSYKQRLSRMTMTRSTTGVKRFCDLRSGETTGKQRPRRKWIIPMNSNGWCSFRLVRPLMLVHKDTCITSLGLDYRIDLPSCEQACARMRKAQVRSK